jgi:hypothetical protein
LGLEGFAVQGLNRLPHFAVPFPGKIFRFYARRRNVRRLVGKLDMLRVECPMCGRPGRYQVARLLEELGAGYRLTDWLSERTADCRQKNQAGVTRACGAVMPDLVDLA